MWRRLSYLRRRLDTSIWFIPALISLASLLLGLFMLWLDENVTALPASWQAAAIPVESARQILSVIAGSVISVGGVSFSVTIVALTLTSGQYGPKVLRHFLEDKGSKISLGLFLGAYVYALVVLTGYQAFDRPQLSVPVALLFALLAIVGFVRFIHHIATDLQADEIVQRIGERLQEELLGMAAADDAHSRSCDLLRWRRGARERQPYLIATRQHGYVQAIDYAGLVRWCEEHQCCLQVRVRAGDFVVEGSGVFKVFACEPAVIEDTIETLDRHIVTGPVRTSTQDPEFPVTQLTQLAARALSPGINDPGTAISCIDSFCLALARIIDREIPGSVFHDSLGEPRLLARVNSFEGLLKAVFAPLRQFAKNDVAVTVSLYEALCRLATLTTRRERLALLGMHGRLISEGVDDADFCSFDLRDMRQRARRLQILVHRFDQVD